MASSVPSTGGKPLKCSTSHDPRYIPKPLRKGPKLIICTPPYCRSTTTPESDQLRQQPNLASLPTELVRLQGPTGQPSRAGVQANVILLAFISLLVCQPMGSEYSLQRASSTEVSPHG